MTCDRCRGACCESFTLFASDVRMPNADTTRWVSLHAIAQHEAYTFACPCRVLTPEGRCGIYADRPEVCRVMPVGGSHCFDMVRRHRTAEQYQTIRDHWDPAVIHG